MTPSISSFEVHPVKDKGNEAMIVGNDEDADFFGLFGLVTGKANSYYVPLGDFADRLTAELAVELLGK